MVEGGGGIKAARKMENQKKLNMYEEKIFNCLWHQI